MIDYVMRQTTSDRTGIQWTFSKQLEDLDFINDVSLLIKTSTCIREAVLCCRSKEDWAPINFGKIEIMSE
jgi:hypothetical protein